jgi:hypothetical protein
MPRFFLNEPPARTARSADAENGGVIVSQSDSTDEVVDTNLDAKNGFSQCVQKDDATLAVLWVR